VFFVPNGIKIDKVEYPITGIDVSAHILGILTLKISKSKNRFYICKSNRGEDFVDLEENYSNAVNKLPIGFYHFSDSINQVKVKQIIF
jgi:GH25 family lysozyme M1 (1,4-beta-N-acetylmuramidase)